jgi:hypothetical protein
MSLTVTKLDVIKGAFSEIGIYPGGVAPSAEDTQLASDLLDELVDGWNIQGLTSGVNVRSVYPLVNGQGGPSNPYTIGPGGDFDTGTQARPDTIREANLLLLQYVTQPTEIPLAILTDAMYDAVQIKELQTQLGNFLYYNRTVPLGTIQIWPVPNTSINSLVLYTDLFVGAFVSLSAAYVCAPGLKTAMRLNLASMLVNSFGASVEGAVIQRVDRMAAEALQNLKDANANSDMADLAIDLAYTPSPRGNYNIYTDTGS